MKYELLLSILKKKHTNRVIEQTETKPQETLEFNKVNKQMQSFAFSPPLNLVEEGRWFLGVSFFGAVISVFKIITKNNSFLIGIPGYWTSRGGTELNNKLRELLEHREQDDIKVHVEEVRKRGC